MSADYVFIAGAASIVLGVAMLSIPAALIIGGALACIGAVGAELGRRG